MEVEQHGIDVPQQEYGVPVISYHRVVGHTLEFGLNSFSAFTHDEGVWLLHTFLSNVLIFYIRDYLFLKYCLINQVYMPVVVWTWGLGSCQCDDLHVLYGLFSMPLHLELGPEKPANFLSSSCKLIRHLPGFDKVIDMCDPVLILQNILLPF